MWGSAGRGGIPNRRIVFPEAATQVVARISLLEGNKVPKEGGLVPNKMLRKGEGAKATESGRKCCFQL